MAVRIQGLHWQEPLIWVAVLMERVVPFFGKVASRYPNLVTPVRLVLFVVESCSAQIPDQEKEPERFL